ncbi:MAG TPA: hypothetical protein VFN57_09810 [Thermomicrobiaceae bacterium]|nr:hypothetical protein [Thermomicrobiaceae bacterium]
MKQRIAVLRLLLVAAVLAAMLQAMAAPALAGSPPNRLDDNRGLDSPVSLAGDVCSLLLGWFSLASTIVCPGMDGRVLEHARVHNVFAGANWDGGIDPQFSRGAIDQLTRDLLASDYFDPAVQYGVGRGSFLGSTQNDGCSGAPSGTTNQLSIELWITCEVQSPGTGVPYPDDDTLYVVYLPPSVDINNGPLGGTCDQFKAYHLQSMALTVDWILVVPYPHFQSFSYAVVPLKCAQGNRDALSYLLSHEVIEAATDPIGPHGWIDNDTIDFAGSFLKEGEAADICGAQPRVRLDNGLAVAPYWSNRDNACVPLTHTLTLETVGLPNAGRATVTSQAIFNDTAPHAVDLATQGTMTIVHNGHASWSFPSPVPGATGVQYVTGSLGSDGTTFIDQDVVSTAVYGTQYRLTVDTSPGVVAAGDGSLTPSQWVPKGQTVTLTTDPYVPAGADRYRFRWWTGDVSDISPSTTVLMDAPRTATAAYVLQHHVTFDQAGIPAGVPWTVMVDNVAQAGPYDAWFDEYTSVSFGYQDPVPALSAGTRYTLVGTSHTTPLLVTGNVTVSATYRTQQLLTVRTGGLPAPNLAGIANGGTPLGTVNDATPLAVWLDDGTPLALAGDASVNGIDGTQYFAQSFAPVPPATLTAPLTTTLTYRTMAQLIDDALASGGITGPAAGGVSTALEQQFAAVQADMKAHRYAAALGSLTAFVNLVEAQRGKAIGAETATTLELDALLVYHGALRLGVAAGQLSPAQASHDYEDYAARVTALGGTPLPRGF